MKKKLILSVLAIAFFFQAFSAIRTYYIQSNPAQVPSLSQMEAIDTNQASTETMMTDGSEQIEDPNQIEAEEIDASSPLLETEPLLYEFAPNSFSDYISINPDFTGWLSISNTAIDYPVVKGRDNEFYLEHDFYKDSHPFGSIFMDYRNLGMGYDQHTILYGHYTPNGHMFADLEHFLSEEFFYSDQTIVLKDLFAERRYEVFSVHIAPADPYFINESFLNPELSDYVSELSDLSLYDKDISFTGDEKLLTLISCNYTVNEGRIYVHAIEVTD